MAAQVMPSRISAASRSCSPTGLTKPAGNPVVEQTEILQLVGRLAGLLGHGVAALVVIDQPAADDGLGHRLAAGAAHLVAGCRFRRRSPAGIAQPQ
jgi:hypothetical protein